MFRAYIDESGIHSGSEMFALAGYLAPDKEWRRFIPKWQGILKKYDISVFHASKCNGNKGEFKIFDGRREMRNLFVAELLGIISDRPRILALNVGVAINEFPDEAHKNVFPGPGHPYFVCMKSLLAQISLVMDKLFPAQERVACTFDRQDQFHGRALELFNQVLLDETWDGQRRLVSIEFDTMARAIPLQAADAIAFDSYREFHRRFYHPERKPRPSYAVLTKYLVARPELIWDQRQAHEMAKSAASRTTNTS